MTARIRVLALVVVIGLGVSGCGLSFHSLSLGTGSADDTYPITIEVSDASQVPVGGRVRIGQSDVGRVGEITVHDYVARITAHIREDVRIPRGTRVRLQLPSPLGEEYVKLTPPRSGAQRPIGPNGVIPLADTTRGPDPEQLLAAVGNLLRGSGIAQATTIVRETNTILHGREGTVRRLLSRLDTVLTTLNEHSGTIERAVHNLARLTGYARDNQRVLDRALDTVAPGINAVLAQRDRFNHIVGRLRTLSGAVHQVIENNRTDIVAFIDKFQGPLESLSRIRDQVGAITAGVSKLGPNLARAIPGDYLTVHAHADLPDVVLKMLGQITSGVGQKLGQVGGPGGPGKILRGASG